MPAPFRSPSTPIGAPTRPSTQRDRASSNQGPYTSRSDVPDFRQRTSHSAVPRQFETPPDWNSYRPPARQSSQHTPASRTSNEAPSPKVYMTDADWQSHLAVETSSKSSPSVPLPVKASSRIVRDFNAVSAVASVLAAAMPKPAAGTNDAVRSDLQRGFRWWTTLLNGGIFSIPGVSAYTSDTMGIWWLNMLMMGRGES